MGCLIVMVIWKEAGFFMIFYLAALQQLSPDLNEAAAVEGAGRWYIFRRITFPLLMPTTLFVAINAVINSFKLVDHLVIMTKGGPNNASTLLLYYIYEVAFTFQDRAYAATLTVVLLAILSTSGADQIRLSRPAGYITNERTHLSARGGRGVGPGPALGCAAGLRVLERASSVGLCNVVQPVGALDFREFRAGLESGAVRPLLSQHRRCWSV